MAFKPFEKAPKGKTPTKPGKPGAPKPAEKSKGNPFAKKDKC